MTLMTSGEITSDGMTSDGMTSDGSATRVPSQLEQLTFKAKEKLIYPVADFFRRLAEPPQAQPIVNQKEMRIVGMRRTGNHALLHWIEQQQSGKYRHLNNVAAGKIPIATKQTTCCDITLSIARCPKYTGDAQREISIDVTA
ncbi:MAG: hypothetical protein HC800_11940 [Phormidesmis sp. RL_2_1]|nr:hypothetical protein [Phormidesmis sp. RL_2_1]